MHCIPGCHHRHLLGHSVSHEADAHMLQSLTSMRFHTCIFYLFPSLSPSLPSPFRLPSLPPFSLPPSLPPSPPHSHPHSELRSSVLGVCLINTSICLAALFLSYLISYYTTESDWACTIFSAIFHYLFLVTSASFLVLVLLKVLEPENLTRIFLMALVIQLGEHRISFLYVTSCIGYIVSIRPAL